MSRHLRLVSSDEGVPPFVVGDEVIVDQLWPPAKVVGVEWVSGVEDSGWLFEVEGRHGRDHFEAEFLDLWDGVGGCATSGTKREGAA